MSMTQQAGQLTAAPAPEIQITVGQNQGNVIIRLEKGLEKSDIIIPFKSAKLLSQRLNACSKQAKRWHYGR